MRDALRSTLTVAVEVAALLAVACVLALLPLAAQAVLLAVVLVVAWLVRARVRLARWTWATAAALLVALPVSILHAASAVPDRTAHEVSIVNAVLDGLAPVREQLREAKRESDAIARADREYRELRDRERVARGALGEDIALIPIQTTAGEVLTDVARIFLPGLAGYVGGSVRGRHVERKRASKGGAPAPPKDRSERASADGKTPAQRGAATGDAAAEAVEASDAIAHDGLSGFGEAIGRHAGAAVLNALVGQAMKPLGGGRATVPTGNGAAGRK